MNRTLLSHATLYVLCALISACAAPQPMEADRNLTVGTVQKEIRVGMSGAEVAEVLGSPNIVSTDEERREVWIYDKMATESASTSNSGFGTVLILGFNSSSNTSSRTTKTLTVIIKFDKKGMVRDFAYHSSKF